MCKFKYSESTKDFNGFAHGGFNEEGSHILPSLFHEGHQEVDGHGKVLPDLVFSLVDVSNCSSQA